MTNLYEKIKAMSREEAAEELRKHLSRESFARNIGKPTLHMQITVWLFRQATGLPLSPWMTSFPFPPEPALQDNHMSNSYARRNPLKNGQFILAIDSNFFRDRGFANGIHSYSFSELFDQAQPYLAIRQRRTLELNPTYRQVLPYKVVMQHIDGQNKLVAYRRLQSGGESRLYGLMSIGFGGHIDLEDVVTYEGESGSPQRSTVDLEATIRASSKREIGEEVHVQLEYGGSVPYTPDDTDIIPSNMFIHYDLRDKLGANWAVEHDVHSVHVAFVYTLLAHPELKFVSGEPEQIELLEPMTAQELLASGLEMEEWTRLLLEYMVRQEALSPEQRDPAYL